MENNYVNNEDNDINIGRLFHIETESKLNSAEEEEEEIVQDKKLILTATVKTQMMIVTLTRLRMMNKIVRIRIMIVILM